MHCTIFLTHTGRREKVLKKFTVVYIQMDLTFEYTTHVLNLFNTHTVTFHDNTLCGILFIYLNLSASTTV